MPPTPNMPPIRFFVTLVLVAGFLGCGRQPAPPKKTVVESTTSAPIVEPPPPPIADAAVKRYCTSCHAWTPPDSLPRDAWAFVLDQMETVYRERTRAPETERPTKTQLVDWFTQRAGPDLDFKLHDPTKTAWPRAFARTPLRFAPPDEFVQPAAVGGVRLLPRAGGFDVLVCDFKNRAVLLYDGAQPENPPTLVARTPYPLRAFPIPSATAPGKYDFWIADLGSRQAQDVTSGAVYEAKAEPGDRWEVRQVLAGEGRIADVAVGDVTGDGKPDAVVAVFGHRKTGRLLLLENVGVESEQTVYERQVIDGRPGCVGVKLVDWDRDGRLDVLALFGQEYEELARYAYDNGAIRKSVLFASGHPGWGMASFDLGDLDGDGDLDVAFANGDTFDNGVPKPYHGVHWLERRGAEVVPHRLGEMPGACAVRIADFDGDGKPDVVVGAMMRTEWLTEATVARLPSLAYWRREANAFAFRPLEFGAFTHAALDVGDLDGDRQPDLVLGVMDKPAEVGAGDGTVGWLLRSQAGAGSK